MDDLVNTLGAQKDKTINPYLFQKDMNAKNPTSILNGFI